MSQDLLLLLAGCGAGMINAVAGGGNLLVLPAFLALGLNPFTAVITGSIVVTPASYASAYGYRRDLRKLPRRYFYLLIPCLLGAAIGIFLLSHTSVSAFEKLLPWLVLMVVILFIFQPRLHRHLHKPAHRRFGSPPSLIVLGLFLASIYGGYFGAGVGFLLLVLFGFTGITSIFQMTALKSLIIGTMGLMTVIVFSATGDLAWRYGLMAATGAAVGGYLGARWAHRISPHLVRLVITLVGTAVVITMFMRTYHWL